MNTMHARGGAPAVVGAAYRASGLVDEDEDNEDAEMAVQLMTDKTLENVIMDDLLQKWTPAQWHQSGWQERRVVVTKLAILFFKDGSRHVIDHIPLIEIEHIQLGTAESYHKDQVREARMDMQNMKDKLASDQTPTSTPATVVTATPATGSGDSHANVNRTMFPDPGTNSKISKSLRRITSMVSTDAEKITGLSEANLDQLLLDRAPRGQDLRGAEQIRTQPSQNGQEEDPNEGRAFIVKTKKNSLHRGKVFFLRNKTPENAKLWIEKASTAREIARIEHKKAVSKEKVQRQLRKVFDHKIFQSVMAILILANFVSSMIQLQMNLDDHGLRVFDTLDVVFTILFLLELILNMATHWFWEFWSNTFNIFDFVVVVITTISLLPFLDLRVISTLRLLRAFRVVRIFARLGSARKIITALSTSIVPVCNVLVVVVGIMCVFAMFGATAYENASGFCTFTNALYTMFRTMCLDGWNQIIETVEIEQPEQPVPVKAFFIIYIFVVVYVLIPVFVAAILDGYRTATYIQSRSDQRHLRKKVALDSDNEVTMSIDNILHSLISCATSKQLEHKLDILFDVVDTDESGCISFEEMRSGFLKLSGGNKSAEVLTLEEFEAITRGGEYLDESGGLNRDSFKLVMGEQLRTYVQRKLAQYILAIGKDDPSQELIFFALKSLATDSGSLFSSRHPIAMRLQDLDEKIEAEQAARREAQDEINYKLDLLLKKVGEVAGEGPGPGDNAHPPPWMQQQQKAPPMGMGNVPSLPTLSQSRSSSSDARGNKGMLPNVGHPGDEIALPPQEPDARSLRHIVLQRWAPMGMGPQGGCGNEREERTDEAELGKLHEQRARFERFVAQQRQHLKVQTEKVNELLMQQRAVWDAQAASGTGGRDSGGDSGLGQMSDTCTNAREPPHEAPPSSALQILPSHLVSGLGLATLTWKRAGGNIASNRHGSDFAHNGCSNHTPAMLVETTSAQGAALPLMPSPGGPGAVFETDCTPRRPGHDSELSRRHRHESAEKSDAALEKSDAERSTVSPLPLPLPDEVDVELSDRHAIIFNSVPHTGITSNVWSSLLEKARGETSPKASSSYGADGRR